MNERIKELAAQAVEETQLMMIMEYKNFESKLYEKFAELIVAECISTLEETIHRSIDHEGDEVWIDLLLKEHFGVEE